MTLSPWLRYAAPNIRGLAALGLGLALAACQTTKPRSAGNASGVESFISTTNKWPSNAVSVCWESSAAAFPTERGWVQNAVAKAFAPTALSWTGWTMCDDVAGQVRVGVDDINPRSLGLGTQNLNLPNGIVFDFTFATWSPSCQLTKEFCIEAIAVHEFGHVAGLAHEQARSDSTCTQEQAGGETPGDQQIGAFDPGSVMNYCNPTFNNGGVFSDGDIAGLAALYGAGQAGGRGNPGNGGRGGAIDPGNGGRGGAIDPGNGGGQVVPPPAAGETTLVNASLSVVALGTSTQDFVVNPPSTMGSLQVLIQQGCSFAVLGITAFQGGQVLGNFSTPAGTSLLLTDANGQTGTGVVDFIRLTLSGAPGTCVIQINTP